MGAVAKRARRGTGRGRRDHAPLRDPAIYHNPDRFDITRTGLPPILTFGAGMNYCLGANLARLEIAEALKVVTRRISKPRRTGPGPWKPFVGLSGPTALPIAFDT
jgi:cytochrome P450